MSKNPINNMLIAGGAAGLNGCYVGLNLPGVIAANVTFVTVFLTAEVESTKFSHPKTTLWEKIKMITKNSLIILSNVFLQVKIGRYLEVKAPKMIACGCILFGSFIIYLISRSKDKVPDPLLVDCTIISGIASIIAGLTMLVFRMFKPI